MKGVVFEVSPYENKKHQEGETKKSLAIAGVVLPCLALVIGIVCGEDEEEEAGVKEIKLCVGLPLSGIA